ncbi:MAG: citrate/2-methylcitrate synthase [Dehalococcoidia bacterium]
MTLDTPMLIPGLEGVPAAESSISLVDGEAGKLYYRGYSIEDLTEGTTFEEVIALLYDGELPDQARVAEITRQLETARVLTDDQVSLARQVATMAHPMFALQSAVAALGPKTNDFPQDDFAGATNRGIDLIAKVGHLVGIIAQASAGRPYEGPRPGESHATMMLRMITGAEPSDLHIRTMDALLNLQADHSAGNASTFTTRVVTSTKAEPEAVVSAAIGALSGPAHGGANEQSLRLFDQIGSTQNAEAEVPRMLDAKVKIPGVGHRVYHVKDPRSIVIQRLASEVLERPRERQLYEVALTVERIVKERIGSRGLWPNVDLFSGCVFAALDIPIDFFTPCFAASRTAGWTAHIVEQLRSGNRIFRPDQIWTGADPRPFVPLAAR